MGGDVNTALRRIVLGYRGVAAAWLAFLGAVAWTGGSVGPVVALGTAGLVAVWAVATVAVGATDPARLARWWWLASDLAVAIFVIVGPGLLEGRPVAFFGGYPFSAVVIAAWARRWPGAMIAAAVLATASVLRPGRIEEGEALPQVVANDYAFYLLAAAVLAWGITIILRNEEERRAAEAALADARAERARAEERAETAVHLHDSVLQTLALIQRRSDDPATVRSLARGQERDLREWLFGSREIASDGDRLGDALERTASDVERLHGVAIEVVRVGDTPVDARVAELVSAAREAMVNAAKHAQSDAVSVFVETSGERVTVYVRDRGTGFDPDAVPADRRGIADSIVGRLRRYGGEAVVRSETGGGTEVELVLPLK